MNITSPYARLTDVPDRDSGVRLLRKIEWCGRISHRSEDAQTTDSWDRFIRAVVLDHGDWSIVEHVSATVDFVVDRGVTHEIVRHRLASYTQESTRFVNYEKKLPPSFIPPVSSSGGSLTMTQGQDATAMRAWDDAIRQCEASYRTLLSAGCSPQIARSVLPNALASRLVMTCNLRNWRHFLLMRTTKESHPQMRQVTVPLLAQFRSVIPLLYDDIEPLTRQSEALRKPR